MSWYMMCLKKYAQFSGRSQRAEYWMFFLFNLIISYVPYLIGRAMMASDAGGGAGIALVILSLLYDLAVFIPAMAVFARRMHDTGRSGWWWLIGLIPIIGGIVLIVWLATDGEPGSNQYGSNPKDQPQAAVIG